MLPLELSSFTGTVNAPKSPSDIIRTDANVKSTVPMNRSAAIQTRAELVYPTASQGLRALVTAALRTTASAQVTNANTSEIEGGLSTITRASGSFSSDGFAVNDIVKVSGAVTAADNRYARVTAVSALSMTVELPDGENWAGDDTDVTVTRGLRLVNGTTDYSYTIEEAWLDLQKMVVWTGCRVSSMDVGFSMGGKATIGFSFVGWDGTPGTMDSATVGITGSTQGSITAAPVFSPDRAILVVADGDELPVRSLSITVDNGARARHSTSGGATPDAVVTGATRVRITASMYYAATTALTQHRAGITMPVWFVLEDSASHAISFSMGSVMWDTASIPTSGIDQDTMVEVTGTATLDSAVGDTIRIQLFQ